MDNIMLCKSFAFCEFHFTRTHHSDLMGGTVCHHIGYIKAGRAEFVTEERTYSFAAGDVFYTPPGCRYHSYWYGQDGDSIVYDAYAFTYLPTAQNTAFALQKLNPNKDAMDMLRRLSAHKQADCTSVGLLYAFFGACMPQMERLGQHPKQAVIDRARSYIRANPRFRMPELAAYCRMSESGLYAAFRDVTGHTPVEEKHRIQIELATSLLEATDLSVEEISDRLGFSSPAYFRAVLWKNGGKSPRDIRRAAQKGQI